MGCDPHLPRSKLTLALAQIQCTRTAMSPRTRRSAGPPPNNRHPLGEFLRNPPHLLGAMGSPDVHQEGQPGVLFDGGGSAGGLPLLCQEEQLLGDAMQQLAVEGEVPGVAGEAHEAGGGRSAILRHWWRRRRLLLLARAQHRVLLAARGEDHQRGTAAGEVRGRGELGVRPEVPSLHRHLVLVEVQRKALFFPLVPGLSQLRPQLRPEHRAPSGRRGVVEAEDGEGQALKATAWLVRDANPASLRHIPVTAQGRPKSPGFGRKAW
mmetsp:Transcript_96400/g.276885  ORF Transcript_96400/g.276885 Transcript_96400/m.276885 type:complete len:265 (+) Transcript_96400:349-1143(+)